MTLRAYTIGMIVMGLVSLASWLLVVFFLSPDNVFSISLFLAALFLSALAFLSIAGFYIRFFISRNELLYIHLKTSLRQGAFFSLILTGMLGLQGFRVLNFWDGGAFVISVMILEFYFLSRG